MIVMVFALSLAGSLLALLLFALGPLLRGRVRKAVAYYLWLIVLLRFCLPVAGPVSLASFQTDRPQGDSLYAAGPATPAEEAAAPLDPTPLAAGQLAPQPAGVAWADAPLSAPEPAEPDHAPRQNPAPETYALSGLLWAELRQYSTAILTAIWAIGFVAALFRQLWQYQSFRRLLRVSRIAPEAQALQLLRQLDHSGKVRLSHSPYATTPMLVGVLRPEIVLPQGAYDRETLGYIFRHELCHHQRRDLYYKWLLLMVTCLHWFNPLVYRIRREISCACELACDEAVIEPMNARERRQYGEVLLSMAARTGGMRAQLATTMSEEKRQMKGRILGIMSHQKRSGGTVALFLALALLLTACGALVGPAGQRDDIPPQETPLSEEELNWFNERYFNGEYGNPNNRLLTSFYEKPEDIDLFAMFYSGTGVNWADGPREEELPKLMAAAGMTMAPEDLTIDYCKARTSDMDAMVLDYLGISLEETNKIGLERFIYLEEFDAYYHFHGDSNYVEINVHYGTRGEDGLITLYYTANGDPYNVSQLRLQDQGGRYHFLSNTVFAQGGTWIMDAQTGMWMPVTGTGQTISVGPFFPNKTEDFWYGRASFDPDGLSADTWVGRDFLLDYVDEDMMVFHTKEALFVCDLEQGQVKYAVSFLGTLGHEEFSGDFSIKVLVSEDGKELMFASVGNVGKAMDRGILLGGEWSLELEEGRLSRTTYDFLLNTQAPPYRMYYGVNPQFTAYNEQITYYPNQNDYGALGVKFDEEEAYLTNLDGTLGGFQYIRDDMVWQIFGEYFD